MFGNAKACFLVFFVIMVLLRTNFAQAGDIQPTVANAGSTGTSVRTPVIPVPAAVGARPSSIVEPNVPEGSQISGVLREIGQRQTELTILELDLKRAELQKKLRELEVAVPANGPQLLPAATPQNSSVPSPMADMGWETQAGPLVRRIHKIGDELVAMIVLPDGEMKNVHSGGFVDGGLRIVEIRPDAVYVRQGDQPRYALPVSQFRRGGS